MNSLLFQNSIQFNSNPLKKSSNSLHNTQFISSPRSINDSHSSLSNFDEDEVFEVKNFPSISISDSSPLHISTPPKPSKIHQLSAAKPITIVASPSNHEFWGDKNENVEKGFSKNAESSPEEGCNYLKVPPSTPSSHIAFSPSSNFSSSSFSSISPSFKEYLTQLSESSQNFLSPFNFQNANYEAEKNSTDEEGDSIDKFPGKINWESEIGSEDEEISFSRPFHFEDEVKNSIDLFEEEENFTGLKRSTNIINPHNSIQESSPPKINPAEIVEMDSSSNVFYPENQISNISQVFCSMYKEKKPLLTSILNQQFQCKANHLKSFPDFMRDLFNLGLFDNLYFLSKNKNQINAREHIKNFLQHQQDLLLLRNTMNAALFHAVKSLIQKNAIDKKEKHFLETISQILNREIDPPKEYEVANINSQSNQKAPNGNSYPFPQYSRFQQEFILLENLGKGGFGHVIKVMHKLDGVQYALKLIRFNTGNQLKTQQVLREVKALAQLDHPNVCRFYNAWIESSDNYYLQETLGNACVFDSSTSDNSESQNSDENSYNGSVIFENSVLESSNTNSFKENNSIIFDTSSFSTLGSGPEIIEINSKTRTLSFTDSIKSKSYTIEFEDSGDFSDHSKQIIPFQVEEISGDDRKLRKVMSTSTKKNNKGHYFIMFIQMQYYRHNTLKNWLEHRNQNIKFASGHTVKPQANWKIFRQIAEGLRYIHSKGIIHRDIKPDNIFISEDGVFKIGDFGLAKEFECEEMQIRKNIERFSQIALKGSMSEHTGGVGTPSYAGPEQLSGNTYDFRSDIYSLGIILFELFFVFGTHSERAKVLAQLRKNVVPSKFQEEFPNECQLIMQLMSQDPLLRPSAVDVLSHPLLNQEQVQISKLGKQLNESQTVIQQQQLRMSELEEKLRELQEQYGKSSRSSLP